MCVAGEYDIGSTWGQCIKGPRIVQESDTAGIRAADEPFTDLVQMGLAIAKDVIKTEDLKTSARG